MLFQYTLFSSSPSSDMVNNASEILSSSFGSSSLSPSCSSHCAIVSYKIEAVLGSSHRLCPAKSSISIEKSYLIGSKMSKYRWLNQLLLVGVASPLIPKIFPKQPD